MNRVRELARGSLEEIWKGRRMHGGPTLGGTEYSREDGVLKWI